MSAKPTSTKRSRGSRRFSEIFALRRAGGAEGGSRLPGAAQTARESLGLAHAARNEAVERDGEARALLRRDRRGAARDLAGLAALRRQIAHCERAADRVGVELAARRYEHARGRGPAA